MCNWFGALGVFSDSRLIIMRDLRIFERTIFIFPFLGLDVFRSFSCVNFVHYLFRL